MPSLRLVLYPFKNKVHLHMRGHLSLKGPFTEFSAFQCFSIKLSSTLHNGVHTEIFKNRWTDLLNCILVSLLETIYIVSVLVLRPISMLKIYVYITSILNSDRLFVIMLHFSKLNYLQIELKLLYTDMLKLW